MSLDFSFYNIHLESSISFLLLVVPFAILDLCCFSTFQPNACHLHQVNTVHIFTVSKLASKDNLASAGLEYFKKYVYSLGL